MKELRSYIKNLLMEVPLDDFEYIKKDTDEDVMVREEVADYFKAIPQSVNIYVAHTDDLSWAHRLPNEIQGKVSGFKSRGQVTLTDISNIGKLYPQIQKEMDPDGINLLYVYPKSFEVPAGADTFVADVNPHYLAHDLHHMLEGTKGLGSKDKDAFTSLIKEYLMELVWLSHGGGSMEAEQVRDTMKRTGRRLGVANTNLLMSELFPGIKLPSGDFDLFGDVFADYLKNDGNLVLGVPEQLDYDGEVIELNPDSKHDQRAQQYEKKFKDLFDTVLDPLKGKVAMFNIFEVESRETERARKQAEEKMQVDHGPLIDLIKAMGGEFKYFDESHQEEGVEELIFGTGLKPEKPVMGVEEFVQRFPKEVESIEALGYKITSAFDGFGSNPVEIRLQRVAMKESVLREYVRSLLIETAIGQCYPHVVKMAKGSSQEEFADLTRFKVAHGRVTDKYSGESVQHAWVEKGDMIFDWQTHSTKPDGISKDVYYDMYAPEIHNEYTAEETMVNCLKSGQAGPWTMQESVSLEQEDRAEFAKIQEIFWSVSGAQAVELGEMVTPDEDGLRHMKRALATMRKFLELFNSPNPDRAKRDFDRRSFQFSMNDSLKMISPWSDVYLDEVKEFGKLYKDLGRAYSDLEGIIGFGKLPEWMPKVEEAAEWAGVPAPNISEEWPLK